MFSDEGEMGKKKNKSGVPKRLCLIFTKGGFESFSLECEQKK